MFHCYSLLLPELVIDSMQVMNLSFVFWQVIMPLLVSQTNNRLMEDHAAMLCLVKMSLLVKLLVKLSRLFCVFHSVWLIFSTTGNCWFILGDRSLNVECQTLVDKCLIHWLIGSLHHRYTMSYFHMQRSFKNTFKWHQVVQGVMKNTVPGINIWVVHDLNKC